MAEPYPGPMVVFLDHWTLGVKLKLGFAYPVLTVQTLGRGCDVQGFSIILWPVGVVVEQFPQFQSVFLT